MLIKLSIIGIILLVGGIIFSSEIQEIFPNTTSIGVNSIKSDLNSLSTKSAQKAQETINSFFEKVKTRLNDFSNQTIQTTEKSIEQLPKKFDARISEIKPESNYVESDKLNNLTINLTE